MLCALGARSPGCLQTSLKIMAGDVCHNYAKYFDNDVLTFGNDFDYFMGAIKHLVTISNYSTTKNYLLLR